MPELDEVSVIIRAGQSIIETIESRAEELSKSCGDGELCSNYNEHLGEAVLEYKRFLADHRTEPALRRAINGR